MLHWLLVAPLLPLAIPMEVFRAMLPFDSETWARARAWTLWKALIVAAGLVETNAVEATRPWNIIDEVLADYSQARR